MRVSTLRRRRGRQAAQHLLSDTFKELGHSGDVLDNGSLRSPLCGAFAAARACPEVKRLLVGGHRDSSWRAPSLQSGNQGRLKCGSSSSVPANASLFPTSHTMRAGCTLDIFPLTLFPFVWRVVHGKIEVNGLTVTSFATRAPTPPLSVRSGADEPVLSDLVKGVDFSSREDVRYERVNWRVSGERPRPFPNGAAYARPESDDGFLPVVVIRCRRCGNRCHELVEDISCSNRGCQGLEKTFETVSCLVTRRGDTMYR